MSKLNYWLLDNTITQKRKFIYQLIKFRTSREKKEKMAREEWGKPKKCGGTEKTVFQGKEGGIPSIECCQRNKLDKY